MIAIDMKMPESCLKCPFENDYCECSVHTGNYVCGDPNYCTYEYSSHRPEWCPLLQVDTFMVEHFATDEELDRFGKDIVMKYIKDRISDKMGSEIMSNHAFIEETRNDDLYPGAVRVRAITGVIDLRNIQRAKEDESTASKSD